MANDRTAKLKTRKLEEQLKKTQAQATILANMLNEATRALPIEKANELHAKWKRATEGGHRTNLMLQRELGRLASLVEARSLLNALAEALVLFGIPTGDAVGELLADVAKFTGKSVEGSRADASRLAELHAQGDCDAATCPVCKATKPAEPISDNALLGLLGLVDVDATLAEVQAWTPEQRELAADWAGREHLSASDNDEVERIPRPAFIPNRPVDHEAIDAALRSPKLTVIVCSKSACRVAGMCMATSASDCPKADELWRPGASDPEIVTKAEGPAPTPSTRQPWCGCPCDACDAGTHCNASENCGHAVGEVSP